MYTSVLANLVIECAEEQGIYPQGEHSLLVLILNPKTSLINVA